MSTKVQNYLEEKLVWRRSSDPHYPYDAEFDGERCLLRVLNNFPEDHLYTLLVDNVEVTSVDDWPEQWESNLERSIACTPFGRTPPPGFGFRASRLKKAGCRSN